MERKKIIRSIVISFLALCLSTWNFSNLSGIENFKAIHIVTLLTCGAAIGVLLVNVMALFRKKE